jgi:hypothetical protein
MNTQSLKKLQQKIQQMSKGRHRRPQIKMKCLSRNQTHRLTVKLLRRQAAFPVISAGTKHEAFINSKTPDNNTVADRGGYFA